MSRLLYIFAFSSPENRTMNVLYFALVARVKEDLCNLPDTHFRRTTNIVYSSQMLSKFCGARVQVDIR